MTRQKSFKRLVRARMEKTGESYTAARGTLLAAEEPKATAGPTLSMSDEAIRRRTGRGWEEWFDLLDEWGAADQPHKEIARWVGDEHAIKGWDAQAVTVNYERARKLRAVGEHADGFTITASKTVAVPVERLYEAFVDGRCAGAGYRMPSSASAPQRGRRASGSTGAAAKPGWSSGSRPRARRRASWRSRTSGSPTPRRRSG